MNFDSVYCPGRPGCPGSSIPFQITMCRSGEGYRLLDNLDIVDTSVLEAPLAG